MVPRNPEVLIIKINSTACRYHRDFAENHNAPHFNRGTLNRMSIAAMKPTCFVMMPFAPIFDGIWNVVIRPTVEAIGHNCYRADDVFSPGIIINDIIDSIKNCNYVIADLTSPNPNVYYELGLCHSIGKPAILITQETASLPFDLRHRRVINYSDTAQGAKSLSESLQRFISQL